MESKVYTAQEMREEADAYAGSTDDGDCLHVVMMLRYAAGVVERCEKELDATGCKDCVMSFNGQHCADYKGCGLHDFHNRFIRIIRGDAGKEGK